MRTSNPTEASNVLMAAERRISLSEADALSKTFSTQYNIAMQSQ
jgi:hypothetical protein